MNVSKFVVLAVLAAIFLFLPGCGQEKEEQQKNGRENAQVEPAKPPAEVVTIKGKVLEVIDDGGKFIYILLDRGEKQTWATMPAVDVEVGEEVSLLYANVFNNFFSKTMNRSFDEMIFSSGIEGKPHRKRTAGAQPPGEKPGSKNLQPAPSQHFSIHLATL